MSTDLTNLPAKDSQLPAHLATYAKTGATGLEEMRNILTPPRLKVMQPMKGENFNDFAVGTALITPTNQVVCELDEYFGLTVLFAYQEFCVHNPHDRPEGLPMIRANSFDFNSEIAKKCQAFLSEPMPEDPTKEIKYATHINALIIVHGVPDFENTPIMLSQYIGEFKAGRRMLDLLASRTQDGSPIYIHNLMAKPTLRQKEKKRWYGLDFSNPTADVDCGKYVPTTEFAEAYAKLHERCKADKERFTIKYEDDDAPPKEGVTSDTLG